MSQAIIQTHNLLIKTHVSPANCVGQVISSHKFTVIKPYLFTACLREHTHTYTRTHARTRIQIHTRRYARTHARTHAHTHTYVHARTLSHNPKYRTESKAMQCSPLGCLLAELLCVSSRGERGSKLTKQGLETLTFSIQLKTDRTRGHRNAR